MAFDLNCQAQNLVFYSFGRRWNLYALLLLLNFYTLISFTSHSLILRSVVEIVGYASRAASNKQAPNPTLAPYVIQTLLLLVAPALFAASIYMILGRIIVSVDGKSLSLIKKRWLTKIFVTSDVISFFVQLGGTYENTFEVVIWLFLTIYRCWIDG